VDLSRPRTALAAAMLASLPAGILAIASFWWTVAALWGGGLWPAQRVTLAEAVATHDEAEIVRLIGFGEDPNGATSVRAGLLGARPARVTPLEAAVWSRDAEMLTLLLRNGAIVSDSELRALRCLNDKEHDDKVRAVLEQLADTPWPACNTAPPTK
jgi:hypothetical protein